MVVVVGIIVDDDDCDVIFVVVVVWTEMICFEILFFNSSNDEKQKNTKNTITEGTWVVENEEVSLEVKKVEIWLKVDVEELLNWIE